jgi:hypothetical protein
MRDKLKIHAENAACAACHRFFDPIGLAFEGFDALGRHRSDDGGLPIDLSGQLDDADFEDAASLGHRMRMHPRVAPCLAQQFATHMLGHEPELPQDGSDHIQVQTIAEAFAAGHYTFPALVHAIAESPLFLYLAAPTETAVNP